MRGRTVDADYLLKRMAKPSVFVASPLGFYESGRIWNRTVVVPTLEQSGWSVLDPWRDVLTDGEISAAQARTVAMRNRDELVSADVVLAILDGSDVDSGTAAEVGYAVGLGKRVVGLRTDTRTSGEYVGGKVNLQIEYLIEESGGNICSRLEDAIATMSDISSQ